MFFRRSILAIILAFVLCGCAENRASFYVQQMLVASEDCDVNAAEGSEFHTFGTLDVGFQWHYVTYPQMRNEMTSTANAEARQAETNGIQVEGANIRIWRGGRPQGTAFYTFYQPAASYIAPGTVGASSFVTVPRQAVTALLQFTLGVDDADDLTFNDMRGYRDLITVGVTMLGTTNGGKELETPEFYFPVHLCFGCLVICPLESADEDTGAVCESTEAPETPGCHLGQDNTIDCRWCATAFGPEEGPELCRRHFCGLTE